jgi:hypothetical protein
LASHERNPSPKPDSDAPPPRKRQMSFGFAYFICKSSQLIFLIHVTDQINMRMQPRLAINKWREKLNPKRMLLMEGM